MINKYTIKKGDIELTVLNIGAVIYELKYKGRNTVINFENLDDYLINNSYIGSVVGRSSGRIKEPKSNGLDLDMNFKGKYNLHGNDLHRVLYNVEVFENKIELTYFDPGNKFPGDMNIRIIYEISNNSLKQIIETRSNIPTVHNFTNHSYFNLGLKSILDHKLLINAQNVWELDEDYFPIKLINVDNTAFDFKVPTLIKENFNKGHKQFAYTRFIDNPYVLDGNIKLFGKNMEMTIETNRDHLVCYMGNFMDEVYGINSDSYGAVCLETQKMPNDLNFVNNDLSVTTFTFENIS